MDLGSLLVADAQPAKLVQPGKAPLHNPALLTQSANETTDETNDKRWRSVALRVGGHSDFVCIVV